MKQFIFTTKTKRVGHLTPIGCLLLVCTTLAQGQTADTSLSPLVLQPPLLQSHKKAVHILEQSLRREAQAAVNRGTDWLVGQQLDNGSWPGTESNLLATAAALCALSASQESKYVQTINNALAFLTNSLRVTHGLGGESGRLSKKMSLQEGAFCLMAFSAQKNAETMLIASDLREQVLKILEDGTGFSREAKDCVDCEDPQGLEAEIFQIAQALDALRLGRSEKSSQANDELQWAAVMPDAWFAGREQPGQSQMDQMFAAMLVLSAAKVPSDAPRVQLYAQLIRREAGQGFSLDVNSANGYLGFYLMARALNKYHNIFSRDSDLPGRCAMVSYLLAEQKIDSLSGHGFWINTVDKYAESSPVFTSALALLSLLELLQ